MYPLSGYYDAESIFGSFLIACYFSVLVTVLLGVPAFLLVAQFRKVTALSTLVGGVVVGVIAALIFGGSSVEINNLLEYGGLGGGAGLLFWLVRRAGHTSAVST